MLIVGLELGEVQVVVEDLAGIVEDGACWGLADYLLQGEAFKSAAWKQFVQVVDIGLQVLSVMERQGLGTDKRFKRIGCVRKFYKCEHIMSV